MAKHHDTGYKELFSHPGLVQQLIEGVAPPERAPLMDFSTLRNHRGHSITPWFEETFELAGRSAAAALLGTGSRVECFLCNILSQASRSTRSMTDETTTEPRDEQLRQWHRLFGIALMEVFEGAFWRVELEQELALRQLSKAEAQP